MKSEFILHTCITGLTIPLITTESGDKYGKSAQNAIWLNSDKTSPFEFYQFLIRTPDADVEKLLKMFTFIPIPEIAELMRKHKVISRKKNYNLFIVLNKKYFLQVSPDKRIPHETLAHHVTTLVHGGIYIVFKHQLIF